MLDWLVLGWAGLEASGVWLAGPMRDWWALARARAGRPRQRYGAERRDRPRGRAGRVCFRVCFRRGLRLRRLRVVPEVVVW